jgi:hypothetical protein
MRRCDIVSGILLILSIIDFTLTAPVLVQEKPQACVDVVHTHKDVITVLGKRGNEELEKFAEEYFKSVRKPFESSDAHASSSSASPRPDHGSTNVVQAPPLNPASSTANPRPLIEPPGPSSTAAMQGSWGNRFNAAWDDVFSNKGNDGTNRQLHALTSLADYGSDDGSTGAHAPELNPNKRPLTDPDPEFDWDYWMSVEDPKPPGPAPPKRPKYENQVSDMYAQRPSPGSSTEWDSEYTDSDDAASSNEVYQEHRVQPNSRPSTESEPEVVNSPLPNLVGSPDDRVEVVQRPPSSPNPELHQPSSAGSEPVDLLAAINAAKGKANFVGTARDVGNATQKELQHEPAERSLDLLGE